MMNDDEALNVTQALGPGDREKSPSLEMPHERDYSD